MINLSKLSPEDIEEKIRLNEESGMDIRQLKQMIEEEMKDFQWVKIRCEVQIQLYTEQLDYINRKLEFKE